MSGTGHKARQGKPAIEKQHGIRRQPGHPGRELLLWRLRIGYAKTLGTCGRQCQPHDVPGAKRLCRSIFSETE